MRTYLGSSRFQMWRFVACLVALAACSPAHVRAAAPRVVPTFHCLGVYWSAADGSPERRCAISYRADATQQWRDALDLWYDARPVQGQPEYRGSIVHLTPGTRYDIRLTLYGNDGRAVLASETVSASTWSEDFPVAKTIHVPDSTASYELGESGTADGYVLYTPAPGAKGTIAVGHRQDYSMDIPARTHHVIIRGFTLTGARVHAINIGTGCHDLVIEDCDISGWGSLEVDAVAGVHDLGVAFQSAICSRWTDTDLTRVIIQRNRIHHPATTSNSWSEARPAIGLFDGHPSGPQAIFLKDTAGNHVIRYNEVFSDAKHYFNDGIGGNNNFSNSGFPNKDSDIYGNRISECWDDGIESEGANCNVRIWNNVIDNTYHKIAIAATHSGPLYVWRNIGSRSRYLQFQMEPVVYCRPAGGGDEERIWDVGWDSGFVGYKEVDEVPGTRHYIIRSRAPSGEIVRTVNTQDMPGCNGPGDRVLVHHPSRGGSSEAIKDENGKIVGFVELTDSDLYRRGSFIKASNRDRWGGGSVYLFHNTCVQDSAEAGRQYRLGPGVGVGRSNDGIFNVIAWNNVLTSSLGRPVFDDAGANGNQYDCNLCTWSESGGSEETQAHGVMLAPFTFPELSGALDLAGGTARLPLAPGSPGIDAGVVIPNFNDGYRGAGPDTGAFETGGHFIIRFGVRGEGDTGGP